ncbi:hypothetical protein AMECASPLE_007482 [Ameca splendens]|uniref:Uncharacterized protein n=1 Tax=Ameca splendens TaxID=208324 RepID=A0ABV0ZW80_9TELE
MKVCRGIVSSASQWIIRWLRFISCRSLESVESTDTLTSDRSQLWIQGFFKSYSLGSFKDLQVVRDAISWAAE